MWNPYKGEIRGTLIEGDPEVPASRWWNIPFLALFVWKTVQVFEVPSGVRPYRVGFFPYDGHAKLSDELITTAKFAVKIGREACRFFAIDMHGREFELKPVLRTTKKDLPPNVTLV